jgi:tetratricopeptide (TPR) repeat protein
MNIRSFLSQVALFSFFISCFLCWPLQTWADQDDPELDRLFSSLSEVNDLAQGSRITREIWQRWRQADDPAIEDLLSSGITAMSSNDLRLALDLFNQIVEDAPEFAEGWNKRATVYYLIGDYDSSIRDIRQTLLLEPRHFGAMAGFAWILLHQRDFEMAERVLRRALSINPFLVDVRRHLRALMDRSG